MPPKKKQSSKQPAKARTPTLINGLTKEELTKEQMEEHIALLREELDREREERNYFQLESDKIHAFREVTERELDEVKAELKNLETEIEEDEAQHKTEIKVYGQKMKHLLCEHQNNIAELKAEVLVFTEEINEDQDQLENELRKKMRLIMVEMQGLGNEAPTDNLKLKLDEEMTTIKNKYEKQFAEFVTDSRTNIQLLQEELDNLIKTNVSEREYRWNRSNNILKENVHEVNMKNYQAAVLRQEENERAKAKLKEKIAECRNCKKRKKTELDLLLPGIQQLRELFSKVEEENAKVQRRVKYYRETGSKEIIQNKKLKALKQEYETLGKKFRKLQLEKDEMEKTWAEDILKLQQKEDTKRLQLEKQVKALTDSVEKTKAQLASVFATFKKDQTARRGIPDKVLENPDFANFAIKNLQA